MNQLVLPGGSTSSRITDVMTKPAEASVGLVSAVESGPVPVISEIEELEGVEAAAIIEAAEETRYRPKVDTNAVQVMRARHHQIARLLAAGHKPAAVGRIMDCSPTTIANLEKSPAFQALLIEYMAMLDEAAVETVTRMRVLANLTVDELTARVVDPTKAKEVKTGDLIEVVKMAADRSGLGPSSTQKVVVNGALSVADIRAIKATPSISQAPAARVFDVGEDGGDTAVRDECEAEGGAEAGDQLRAPDREAAEVGDFIDNLIVGVVPVRG